MAPVKPVPVIVTATPPSAGHLFGLTPVTVGGGPRSACGGWSGRSPNCTTGPEFFGLVPAGVVTFTSSWLLEV